MQKSKHYERPNLVDLSSMEWEAGAGQCGAGSGVTTQGCNTGGNIGAGGCSTGSEINGGCSTGSSLNPPTDCNTGGSARPL
jgi:hypothetical protein